MHLLPKAPLKPGAPQPALLKEEPAVRSLSDLAFTRRLLHKEIPLSVSPLPSVTLFTYRFDTGLHLTSFAFSILAHSIAVAIIWFGITYKPPTARVDAHYISRRLDLRTPDLLRQAASAGITYPGMYAAATPRPASSGKASPRLQHILRQMARAKPGPQTLIQPDLSAYVSLDQEIPVPQVVIWSPSQTQVKRIVPPLQQKPTAADVKPSYDSPNQELNLADVNIASSEHPLTTSPVPASTTSPVAVHLPLQVELPPVSASQNQAQPTPAAILSLSDLRMEDGTTVLPPVNESAVSNVPGEIEPGSVQNPSQPTSGNPAAKQEPTGAGSAIAAKPNASGSGSAAGPSVAAAKPGTSTPAQGAVLPSQPSAQPALTEISLPKNGRFSAVIVGEALEDEFPELAGAWSGRVAYTVYLHVGLARSWILQYSLPRDADAAAAGTVAHIEAPWPYSIVRPNLAPESVDADALMIHGFIDPSGRFQDLNLAFPPAFPHAQFVLDALKQWQFRPAAQNGQPVRIEILLVIPEQP